MDRWRQIEALFDKAQGWDPASRAARLAAACGDDVELRREVEQLLARHEQAEQLLDHPSWVGAGAVSGNARSPIEPGTMLGAYEIEALLGAGGMGEVWKARDLRLNRTVAIKVSHAQFSNRLEREAKAVAALNHPNIAALYDVGVAPSGFAFLVLEYVEGPTLADRMMRGRMPLPEALSAARQVADAIESAHERGIIHRDLKPANIKVRADGAVKVLDFGLAKALDISEAHAAADATAIGAITGTAAYMSPEQAAGKDVDRRTDIWSFGVVLCEMVTGRRPFAGNTAGDIIEAVIAAEPQLEEAPAEWRPLIARCLTKDRRERLQSIGEARIALTRPFDDRSRQRKPIRARAKWPAMIAGTATIIALALIAGRFAVGRSPAAMPETRVEIMTHPTGDARSFAVSPDGRSLAYVALDDQQSRLWVRPMSSTTAQPVAITEGGAAYPFWSPDSRSIAFFSGGKLRRVNVTGGAVQVVADALSGRGGTWNADGLIVFAPSPTTPLFKVPAAGGDAVAVTRLGWPGGHRFPEFLPDGRHFLFYAEGAPNNVTNTFGSIYIGSLDSPETKHLTSADTAALYMPPDWLVFVRGGALLADHLDLARLDLAGRPQTIADSVFFDTSHARWFSVSASGLIAYRRGVPSAQLTWFDRSGKVLGVADSPANGDGFVASTPRISPDGRSVLVRRRLNNQSDLWILGDTGPRRFTFAGATGGVWSPDSGRIAFEDEGPGRHFFLKPADHSANQSTIETLPEGVVAKDWSTDGRFLLCETGTGETGHDLWLKPLDGDRTPRPLLSERSDEKEGRFSPDARFIAYQSNATGRSEIYLQTFNDPRLQGSDQGPSRRWQVSLAGGIGPTWRRDGKELYWIAPDGQLMAATITIAGDVPRVSPPSALFRPGIFGGGLDANTNGAEFDVAPDGRFLIVTAIDTSASAITLVQNWSSR